MEWPYGEADTTFDSRTRQLIENKIPFGGHDSIDYFNFAKRKRALYKNIDLPNAFADINDEPPKLRVFFLGYEKDKLPRRLLRHYYVPLSKLSFLRLLIEATIPPVFIDIHTDNNGVYSAYPSFLNPSRCPKSFHLFVRYPNTAVTWCTLYYRYEVSQEMSTMLVIGTYGQRYQSRVKELYRETSSDRGQRDPFDVVAIIITEVSAILEEQRRNRDLDVQIEESKTGFAPMRSSPPANHNSIAVGSTRSLHTVLGHLRFLHRLAEFQVCLIEFVIAQHESLTKVRKARANEAHSDSAAAEDSAEKTRRSLDLSLSSNRTRLRQINELIYRITAQIRIVDNMIMQRDSRATIAIAEQAQRTAVDTKRESVAMRTISALTMIFLPGTFVGTIFGMAFFNYNENGTNTIRVSPVWWLYVVITVPLTGLILGLWVVWLRWSMRSTKTMDIAGLGIIDLALQDGLQIPAIELANLEASDRQDDDCSSVDEQHLY
ncbi:MAG: hypothetical protein Q9198_004390 [Flavoplaca austrocitrina]